MTQPNDYVEKEVRLFNSIFWLNNDGNKALRTSLLATAQHFKEEGRREAIEEVLEDYTSWLCKQGFADADVYAEKPTAVERYLAALKEIK